MQQCSNGLAVITAELVYDRIDFSFGRIGGNGHLAHFCIWGEQNRNCAARVESEGGLALRHLGGGATTVT